jgi:hypothetical protein
MHLYFILGDVLYRVTPKKIDKKNPAKLLMTNFLLEGSYYIMCVYDYISLSLSLFEHLGVVASFVQATPIHRAPFAGKSPWHQDLPSELPSEVTFAAAVSACTEVTHDMEYLGVQLGSPLSI